MFFQNFELLGFRQTLNAAKLRVEVLVVKMEQNSINTVQVDRWIFDVYVKQQSHILDKDLVDKRAQNLVLETGEVVAVYLSLQVLIQKAHQTLELYS